MAIPVKILPIYPHASLYRLRIVNLCLRLRWTMLYRWAFTEGFGDSLAGDIGVAVFSLLIALFFGFVTRRGIKEMQGHRTIDNA